jgi:hypothetical protein
MFFGFDENVIFMNLNFFSRFQKTKIFSNTISRFNNAHKTQINRAGKNRIQGPGQGSQLANPEFGGRSITRITGP